MKPAKWSPTTLFVLAIAAAAVGGAVLVLVFSEENYLVELGAGFGASLLAFAVALSWERHREDRQMQAERDRELRELQSEEARREKELLDAVMGQEEQTRKEATRLLTAVSKELEINGQGLEYMSGELARIQSDPPDRFVPALPLLSDGMWKAAAPRLAQILDYDDLVGDLASFYGEIEELRFRVRHRTQAQTFELDAGIEELLRSAAHRLEKLHRWVSNVAADPIVGPLRLLHAMPVPTRIRVPQRRRNA